MRFAAASVTSLPASCSICRTPGIIRRPIMSSAACGTAASPALFQSMSAIFLSSFTWRSALVSVNCAADASPAAPVAANAGAPNSAAAPPATTGAAMKGRDSPAVSLKASQGVSDQPLDADLYLALSSCSSRARAASASSLLLNPSPANPSSPAPCSLRIPDPIAALKPLSGGTKASGYLSFAIAMPISGSTPSGTVKYDPSGS